jgi:sensor histidine kinase regulating citrate/malate metabolism
MQKAKLVHVLISLLDNATESIEETERKEKSISISVTRNGDDVLLKISDTGIGIPRENLKKIFMHDFRNTKNQQCFSLHCSAIYMAEMKGTIWAESEGVDQGATFILKLPIH